MTVVVANARLELLRALARVEDITKVESAECVPNQCIAMHGVNYWPTHVPLFVGDWNNDWEDILVAARECSALGEIEYNDKGRHPNGPMVRITDVGYARIRAHDLAGELAQEQK